MVVEGLSQLGLLVDGREGTNVCDAVRIREAIPELGVRSRGTTAEVESSDVGVECRRLCSEVPDVVLEERDFGEVRPRRRGSGP